MSMDVEKNLDYWFKVTNLGLRGVTTVTMVLTEILKLFGDRENEKALLEELRQDGKLRFVVSTNEISESLKKELDYQGIPYHESASVSMNGKKVIVFSEKDVLAVENVLAKMRLEHNRGGVIPYSMLIRGTTSIIQEFTTEKECDARIIAELAKEKGINISILDRDFQKCVVCYEKKDAAVMDNIKRTLILQKSYPEMYKHLEKQMAFEEQRNLKLAKEAKLYNQNKPYYLVSTDGTTVEVTANKVTVREPGAQTPYVIDTDDITRDGEVEAMVCGMQNPQKFEEKEYMDFTKKNPKHQKQILSEKDKSAGRPEMDIEAYLDMHKALESKALYEEKLALDNPEHEIYNYAFENNEMRMAAFEEYERLNRDVIQEKKSRYLDPEIHESLKNVDMQYPDTESNIQIEEAEKQVFAQDREKEMEHLYGDRDWDRTDVGYDKNNNWIPDEYEKN